MSSELDSIMLDYKKVSEAPTLDDLIAEAERDGISIGKKLNEEQRIRYKALRGKDVYLVENPALYAAQMILLGRDTIKRREPQYCCRIGDRPRRSAAPMKEEGVIQW